MKEWRKPEILSLNVRATNGGGYGPPTDGVQFQVNGNILLGTSGPTLDYPVVN
jgi:hypothetical protein